MKNMHLSPGQKQNKHFWENKLTLKLTPRKKLKLKSAYSNSCINYYDRLLNN
jgi:hypothetical protein